MYLFISFRRGNNNSSVIHQLRYAALRQFRQKLNKHGLDYCVDQMFVTVFVREQIQDLGLYSREE